MNAATAIATAACQRRLAPVAYRQPVERRLHSVELAEWSLVLCNIPFACGGAKARGRGGSVKRGQLLPGAPRMRSLLPQGARGRLRKRTAAPAPATAGATRRSNSTHVCSVCCSLVGALLPPAPAARAPPAHPLPATWQASPEPRSIASRCAPERQPIEHAHPSGRALRQGAGQQRLCESEKGAGLACPSATETPW